MILGLSALIEGPRPPWQAQARCRRSGPGHDAFFRGRGESQEEAQAICASCEVRAVCLEYALEHGTNHGVWGGTSESERRRIGRERKAASATDAEATRLAERGVHPSDIAQQLGVTTRTVYRHL